MQTDTLSSAYAKSTSEDTQTADKNANIIETEGVSWRKNKQSITKSKFQIFQGMNSYQQLSKQYTNKVARMLQNFCSILCNTLEGISTAVVHFVVWLCSTIYAWFVKSECSTKLSSETAATKCTDNKEQMQEMIFETTNKEIQEELKQQNQQQQQSSSTGIFMKFVTFHSNF